jgi:hypothetical protein
MVGVPRKDSSFQNVTCRIAGQSGIREESGMLAETPPHCPLKEPQPSQSDNTSISRSLDVCGKSLQCPERGSQRLVYVRYKDHVIFKNVQDPLAEAVVRETVGWVKKENEEIMLIEHDRAILQGCSGFNGVVILKSCILGIVELPLQSISNWSLNCTKDKERAEYALQPKERKTQPRTTKREG